MSNELYQTIEMIGREKGIDPDVIIQAVEEAYAAASRKYLHSKEDFGARFDRDSGRFIVFSKQTVVTEDELMDPHIEITVEEARQIKPDVEVGAVIETVKDGIDIPLTRIAAQAAKQVIYQKVKEAEREIVWREYGDRIGELLTGQVKRFDRGDMIVDLGRTEGIIPRREQSRAEHYNPGDRIRAVLVNVERLGKGPQLTLSRASELLVKKLFEMEVPEIYDGTVLIVSVARDAGERTKIAARSKDRDVDPVGACVGMKGSRVQAVIRELRGEKIDIVKYDEDPALYVRHALSPASINRVSVRDYEAREMEVIVPRDLSSARAGWKLISWLAGGRGRDREMGMAPEQPELSLPGIAQSTVARLLDAGFRGIEEICLASLEDLTSIDGISEDEAIEIHDAAEQALDARAQEEESDAAAQATGAEMTSPVDETAKE
jgi:N utilization substance protein A